MAGWRWEEGDEGMIERARFLQAQGEEEGNSEGGDGNSEFLVLTVTVESSCIPYVYGSQGA